MLDFDGVLHPEFSDADLEFCRLDAFETALRELPALPDIVISSSWRFGVTLDWLRGHFSPDIAARIVGVTPGLQGYEASSGPGSRQREIEAWITEHRPDASWLAIDDMRVLFDAGCPHLVHTNTATGVSFDDLEEIKRRLGSELSSTPVRRPRP